MPYGGAGVVHSRRGSRAGRPSEAAGARHFINDVSFGHADIGRMLFLVQSLPDGECSRSGRCRLSNPVAHGGVSRFDGIGAAGKRAAPAEHLYPRESALFSASRSTCLRCASLRRRRHARRCCRAARRRPGGQRLSVSEAIALRYFPRLNGIGAAVCAASTEHLHARKSALLSASWSAGKRRTCRGRARRCRSEFNY